MYVYIYTCIYVHMYVCMYVHVYIYTYICMYVHVYVYVCMQVMYVFTTNIYKQTHTHTLTHTHTYTHISIYVYTCICVYIDVYVCMHAMCIHYMSVLNASTSSFRLGIASTSVSALFAFFHSMLCLLFFLSMLSFFSPHTHTPSWMVLTIGTCIAIVLGR
jgi:hypothetical protein